MVRRASLACVLALVLSSCDRKAEGQTVAVVNGEEITASELNAELQRANIPPGEATKEARARVLQGLVDRELLTQQAEEAGIDKSPEFVTQERLLRDNLLINMLVSRQLNTAELPSAENINKFEASRPEMFAGREMWTLQQLVYPTPENPAIKKKIEATKSLDEIARVLNENGIAFTRNTNRVDTASFPHDIWTRVRQLPQGEPFVFVANDRTIASVVTEREAAPRTGEQARPTVLAALRKQTADEVLKKRLEAARKSAEISYQPGFEPPANQTR